MKIQPIFNNAKWGNEAKRLAEVKTRLEKLTRGKLEITFKPTIYTDFKDIPFAIYMFPFTNETADAPSPSWWLEKVYPLLADDVDLPMFITTKTDWNDHNLQNGFTEAYCHNHSPATFPHFISFMAEPSKRSGRHKDMYILEGNAPHEFAHAFSNICDIPDRTHELDYSNRTQELYDLFDYEKIKVAINQKRKLSGRMEYYYTKPNDGTFYMLVEGKLVGFSTNYDLFRKDWPAAKEIKLTLDQFNAFNQANWHTLEKRN